MTGKAFKYWLLAFVVSSLNYLVIRTFSNLPFEWAPKVIPIVLLMLLVKKSLQGRTQSLMLAALSCSLAGDVLLSLHGLFIAGLGAFLLAHILYTALFIAQFKVSKNGVAWLSLVALYTLLMGYLILPHAQDLSLVVSIYLLAISSMAVCAGFRNDRQFLWVAFGALIFMVSDSLIAINKFVEPFALAGPFIMVTYYLAQLMITLGIIRHHRLQHPPAMPNP